MRAFINLFDIWFTCNHLLLNLRQKRLVIYFYYESYFKMKVTIVFNKNYKVIRFKRFQTHALTQFCISNFFESSHLQSLKSFYSFPFILFFLLPMLLLNVTLTEEFQKCQIFLSFVCKMDIFPPFSRTKQEFIFKNNVHTKARQDLLTFGLKVGI